EAQVDLALENAGLRGSGAAVTANLEVAGQLLDDELYFGDSETAVLALDEALGAPPRARGSAPRVPRPAHSTSSDTQFFSTQVRLGSLIPRSLKAASSALHPASPES